MDERDDDLESTVHEDAVGETDTFPTTADELDSDDNVSEEDSETLDDDEAEL